MASLRTAQIIRLNGQTPVSFATQHNDHANILVGHYAPNSSRLVRLANGKAKPLAEGLEFRTMDRTVFARGTVTDNEWGLRILGDDGIQDLSTPHSFNDAATLTGTDKGNVFQLSSDGKIRFYGCDRHIYYAATLPDSRFLVATTRGYVTRAQKQLAIMNPQDGSVIPLRMNRIVRAPDESISPQHALFYLLAAQVSHETGDDSMRREAKDFLRKECDLDVPSSLDERYAPEISHILPMTDGTLLLATSMRDLEGAKAHEEQVLAMNTERTRFEPSLLRFDPQTMDITSFFQTPVACAGRDILMDPTVPNMVWLSYGKAASGTISIATSAGVMRGKVNIIDQDGNHSKNYSAGCHARLLGLCTSYVYFYARGMYANDLIIVPRNELHGAIEQGHVEFDLRGKHPSIGEIEKAA